MSGHLKLAARVCGILAILYISLFALDVFQEGVPITQAVVALLIHLAPSYLLVLVLILAWFHPFWGGVAFLLVAALPFLLLNNPTWVNLLLSVPFAVTGALFLASLRE